MFTRLFLTRLLVKLLPLIIRLFACSPISRLSPMMLLVKRVFVRKIELKMPALMLSVCVSGVYY